MVSTVNMENVTPTGTIAVGSYSGQARGPGRNVKRLAVAGAGLLGLVAGGFPLWAAHRILYPVHTLPLPHGLAEQLTLDNGTAAEYVEYPASDGGLLSAWFVPPPARVPAPWPVILLAYGYGGYKEQMVAYAQMVHDAGFASMMFDMSGSGLRKGRPVSLGFEERWDMLDAALYVRSRQDVDPERIGALGVSMGGATALLAAEKDTSIRAIVADSSYARLDDMIRPGLRAFVGSPAVLFAPLIVRLAETMLGIRSSQVQPVQSAAKLGERALLVIHGEDDPLTTPRSATDIYDAASGPKEIWMVPDCGHARAPEISFEEYKSRINNFFLKYLTPKAN